MSRRLTLHLTARHNAALDRILGGDDSHDNNQRRRAVEQLILDGAREPGDRVGAQNTTAVEPPGATDGSAARNDTESTVRLIDRLKASRDQYRDLAVRAEAALLGVPVRDDHGSIERRLERALRDKGFEMPAATHPRRPADRPPAGSRRRGGRQAVFVLFLIVALIAGAVLLALNAHERVEGLLLFDKATGATVLEGWAILAQHSVIAGILATVVFLLALAIGLSTSELHIRAALRLRREWLDRRYRDDQLGVARDDCRRLRKQLADAQRQLVAVKGQRAGFRRSLRQVTRERDRALKAAAAREPPSSAPSDAD